MSPFPQYNRQSDQTLSEAQLYQFNSFAGFAQDNNTKDLSQSPMPTPTPISLPLHPSSSSSACSFQFDLSEHNSISHHSTPFDHEDDDSTSNTAQASWDSPAHLSSSSQTNLAADLYQQTFGLKQELPVWNMTSSFNNANNTHHNNANTTHEPEKQNTQFACSQQSQNSNQNQNQQSILYSQISVPPARLYNEYLSSAVFSTPGLNHHLSLPSPVAPFGDESSSSDLISDMSSPGDFVFNEPNSYFPNAGQYNNGNSLMPSTTPKEELQNVFYEEGRPISPAGLPMSATAVGHGLPSPPTSIHNQRRMPVSFIDRGRSQSSGIVVERPPHQAFPPLPLMTKSHSISGPTASPSAVDPLAPPVELDINGRKPRQWRNRKYRCSHCTLVFFDRDLALYARHIEKVEAEYEAYRNSSHGGHGNNSGGGGPEPSGRKFKCPEPTCPWSKIGFVRKLEQQKHYTRKHGNPTFECRFWCPDGKEKFPGCRVCTTHWHADSGNRLRHERAVHGVVWSETYASQVRQQPLPRS